MIKALYRLRGDGDYDFLAAFDVESCDLEAFANNVTDGAGYLLQTMIEALEACNETGMILEYESLSQIVDVFTGPNSENPEPKV